MLSGCILSEFFKVLPEAFRDDATDLCRCYPELQESVSHYTELCSGKTMRLHKLDQGVFGVLSTITLYRVSSQTDMRALEAYINERLGAILELNPWLGGRLAKAGDDIILQVPREEALGVVKARSFHIDFDPSTDYDALLDFAATTAGVFVDTAGEYQGAALFKVSLLELGDNTVGLALAMNHKLGDAYTLYKVQAMLSDSAELGKLVAQRDLGFARDAAVNSARFSEGCGGARHTCVLEVDPNSLAALRGEQTPPQFISKHDVLTSLLMKATDPEMCCLLANMRGRLPGIGPDMAGNYIGAAVLADTTSSFAEIRSVCVGGC